MARVSDSQNQHNTLNSKPSTLNQHKTWVSAGYGLHHRTGCAVNIKPCNFRIMDGFLQNHQQ